MAFHRILVAVDFSEPAREALAMAARLASESGGELVLAHVAQPAAYTFGPSNFPAGAADAFLDDTMRALADWTQQAESLGAPRVDKRVRIGPAWYEIVVLLHEEPSFDLVVIGTHGRTGLAHVMLGSVAEKVVRHAPRPVLVVGRSATESAIPPVA